MKLRQGRKIDYRSLANGDPIGKTRTSASKLSWPSSKLWNIEILDSRQTDGKDEVLVHYTGWSGFGEWRDVSDVVDRNPDLENSDAYSSFVSTLKINIKDNLKLSRVQDTEITLKVPVQKETFEIFLDNLQLKKWKTVGNWDIYRGSIADFTTIFGQD